MSKNIDMSKEYILCSAIRRKVCVDCKNSNTEIGDVCLGYRHCDIIYMYRDLIDSSVESKGFFTSHGRFVGREEGYLIAVECGQIKERDYSQKLYIEDLY